MAWWLWRCIFYRFRTVIWLGHRGWLSWFKAGILILAICAAAQCMLKAKPRRRVRFIYAECENRIQTKTRRNPLLMVSYAQIYIIWTHRMRRVPVSCGFWCHLDEMPSVQLPKTRTEQCKWALNCRSSRDTTNTCLPLVRSTHNPISLIITIAS